MKFYFRVYLLSASSRPFVHLLLLLSFLVAYFLLPSIRPPLPPVSLHLSIFAFLTFFFRLILLVLFLLQLSLSFLFSSLISPIPLHLSLLPPFFSSSSLLPTSSFPTFHSFALSKSSFFLRSLNIFHFFLLVLSSPLPFPRLPQSFSTTIILRLLLPSFLLLLFFLFPISF